MVDPFYIYMTPDLVQARYGFAIRMWADQNLLVQQMTRNDPQLYYFHVSKSGRGRQRYILKKPLNAEEFERICPLMKKEMPQPARFKDLGWKLGQVPLHPWLSPDIPLEVDTHVYKAPHHYEFIGTLHGMEIGKTPLIKDWYKTYGFATLVKKYRAASYGGFDVFYVRKV